MQLSLNWREYITKLDSQSFTEKEFFFNQPLRVFFVGKLAGRGRIILVVSYFKQEIEKPPRIKKR